MNPCYRFLLAFNGRVFLITEKSAAQLSVLARTQLRLIPDFFPYFNKFDTIFIRKQTQFATQRIYITGLKTNKVYLNF